MSDNVCNWYRDNPAHAASSPSWSWSLCPQCDAAVLHRAQQLVSANKPVTYPDFGDLPSQQTLQKGGFWQYDVLKTLVGHYGWIRHTRQDRLRWVGKCGFPTSRKPETHFHPPGR